MRDVHILPLPLALSSLLLAGCNVELGTPSNSAAVFAVEAEIIDSIGVAGLPLSTPLDVRVRKNGKYAEGVRVYWRTQSGRVDPASSVTNARGVATTKWTLGNTLGPVLATAATDETASSPSATFRTVVYEPVTVVRDSATDAQRATVSTTLPRRLRVQVRSAAGPRAGVTVFWSASAGVVSEQSVTDANGYAETAWLLPTMAANGYSAYAMVPGFSQRVVSFSATATAGPIVRLTNVNGAERIVAARSASVPPLVVGALDAFGNRVTGAPVVWSVVNGPVTLKSGTTSLTDYLGFAEAVIATQGVEGAAVVRASAGTYAVDFKLNLAPGLARVMLDTRTGRGWLSEQNGSQPAFDTIVVGETVVFGLSMFDYDNHDVMSASGPFFQGREFPYANPSEVYITFNTLGLHRYQDSYTGATGSVLVVSRSVP